MKRNELVRRLKSLYGENGARVEEHVDEDGNYIIEVGVRLVITVRIAEDAVTSERVHQERERILEIIKERVE
jgi:hypothetical protein